MKYHTQRRSRIVLSAQGAEQLQNEGKTTMPIIKNDEMYASAVAQCSENIKQFLTLLNRKTSDIDWDRLEYDGCIQPDGSFFSVISTVRTAEEQIECFKMGRRGVEYHKNILSTANSYCPQTPAIQYELISRGIVVDEDALASNAWAGQSYHNWGLALDLILTKFGDPLYLDLQDGRISIQDYYALTGLSQLAASCSLEWGGNWTGFTDIPHFQDTAYRIPPKEYHYDRNMNFQFIKRFYIGTSSNDSLDE
jgi:hypothetical protein